MRVQVVICHFRYAYSKDTAFKRRGGAILLDTLRKGEWAVELAYISLRNPIFNTVVLRTSQLALSWSGDDYSQSSYLCRLLGLCRSIIGCIAVVALVERQLVQVFNKATDF